MLPLPSSAPHVSSRQLYYRLLLQFSPYTGALIATLFAVGIASLTDVLLIRQLQNVVDALGPGAGTHGPAVAGGVLSAVQEWLHRLPAVNASEAALWTIPAIIMALAFLRMVSSFAGDYGSAWLSNRVQADLRGKMFARILRLPNGYFDHSSTGTTLSTFCTIA